MMTQVLLMTEFVADPDGDGPETIVTGYDDGGSVVFEVELSDGSVSVEFSEELFAAMGKPEAIRVVLEKVR